MTTGYKTINNPVPHSMPDISGLLKASVINLALVAPTLVADYYLMENRIPPQESYTVSCIVLLLTALNFTTIIMIEPYRRRLSKEDRLRTQDRQVFLER